VRAYIEGVWGEAAARFRLAAANTPGPGRAVIEPWHHLRRGGRARPRILDLDAAGPDMVAAHTHHTQRKGTRLAVEPRPGGRVFERDPDGTRSTGAPSWNGSRRAPALPLAHFSDPATPPKSSRR